ncbi:DUF4351 domain-containing protein [Clostridium arbusti]|uniref:DUF4351 domain-containing protein n=1 Tax=Clostridium arbusti TaxID=1137848 RepID=UPI001FB06B23|nr:DUF4351 domain-containing protein [Clostridium arbusti]
MSNNSKDKTRKHIFDETIKALEKKDAKTLGTIGMPEIENAEELHLEFSELSMSDMKRADYLAKVEMNDEKFILHMEFESNYSSNRAMNKRMLRYLSSINWYDNLPIYQVLIILKSPQSTKNINNKIEMIVQGEKVLEYSYKVVKVYDMNKYEVLNSDKLVLYPLRIFMQHGNENDEEHIKECLKVVEELEDKDYYYLTVELSKRLYKFEVLENYIKEEIYMASELYKEPYEKGREEGIKEGIKEGKRQELIKTIVQLLTKKFGILPKEIKNKIEKSDYSDLEVIVGDVFGFEILDDVKKYLSDN